MRRWSEAWYRGKGVAWGSNGMRATVQRQSESGVWGGKWRKGEKMGGRRVVVRSGVAPVR